MGLNANVFRANREDCTNGGVSSFADKVCIVNIDGPFKPSNDYPPAILTTNSMGSPVIKPAHMHHDGVWLAEPGWLMMGGNFVYTSDSRFSEAVSKIAGHKIYGAIPMHDRLEAI